MPTTQRVTDFEQVYCTKRPTLIRMVERRGADHETACDVVQTGFLRAWKRLDQFRGEASLYSWVTTVVLNEWRDVNRRNHCRPIEQPTDYTDIWVEPKMARKDRTEAHILCYQLMATLKPHEVDVLEQHYWQGDGYLGKRGDKIRAFRAIRKMRRVITA